MGKKTSRGGCKGKNFFILGGGGGGVI